MDAKLVIALVGAGAALAGSIVGVGSSVLVAWLQRKTEIKKAEIQAKLDLARLLNENRRGAYVPVLEMCWQMWMGHKGKRDSTQVLEVAKHRAWIGLLGSTESLNAYLAFVDAYDARAADPQAAGTNTAIEEAFRRLQDALRSDVRVTATQGAG